MNDDIQLQVGGSTSATNAEVDELNTGLSTVEGDDKNKTATPPAGEEDDGGGDDDGAAHPVEEDERSGRVDAELQDAANEQEREAIRARRRQERVDKKARARDRVQTLERQVQQSQRTVAELTEQVQLLSQQSQGVQMARLDAAITEVNDAVTYFESMIADATTKGDGDGVAKATSNLFAARERAKELATYKEAAVKSSGRPQAKALDPKVVNHAKTFMGKHSWYGGPRSQDLDSKVLSQIDNQVAAEGFDPTGPEYWQELEARASRYLPHRFQRASSVVDDPDDAANGGGGSGDGKSGYNGRANGDRRTPRQSVAGNSGDARGPKGGGEGFHLSAERVKAIKDAGAWDDPKSRKAMIDSYKTYDREHGSR